MRTGNAYALVLLIALRSASVQAHSGWSFESIINRQSTPKASGPQPETPSQARLEPPHAPTAPTAPRNPPAAYTSDTFETTAGKFGTTRRYINEALQMQVADNEALARHIREQMEKSQVHLECRFIVAVWEDLNYPGVANLGRGHGVATNDKACNVAEGVPAEECSDFGGSIAFIGTSMESAELLFGMVTFFPVTFQIDDAGALLKHAGESIQDCVKVMNAHRHLFKITGFDLSTLAECIQVQMAKAQMPEMAIRLTAILPSESLKITSPYGNYLEIHGSQSSVNDDETQYQLIFFPMPLKLGN